MNYNKTTDTIIGLVENALISNDIIDNRQPLSSKDYDKLEEQIKAVIKNSFPKIKRKQYDEEVKCGGCNYRTTTLFGFKGQDLDKIGLCGDCFSNFLADGEAGIEK